MIDVEKIIYLYMNQQLSMNAIAHEIGCCPATVRRKLIENNIEIRDNNCYKKKQIDETFFECIDTEEKAYILGFIYADGYVTGTKFGIKQCKKDCEILEKIKRALKSNHKIGFYINKNGYVSGNEYCSFIVDRRKMVNDLISLGVCENKSKILEFPNYGQVPQELMKHFIRGYFDGDGSVYLSNEHIYSNFTGTEHMLLGIKKELNNLNLNTKASIRKYPEKDIYDFKLGGINIMRKFYHILYDEATIFMNRKRNIFNDYFNNEENF